MNETTTFPLHTWTVVDSEGWYHTVQAEYIAHPVNSDVLNFIDHRHPNLGIVASFTRPVAIFLKEENDST